jgi:hypothetical protein
LAGRGGTMGTDAFSCALDGLGGMAGGLEVVAVMMGDVGYLMDVGKGCGCRGKPARS